MRKFLLGFSFIMVACATAFAQPVNNDCVSAISIPIDGSCNLYDFTMATFDLVNGGCAPNAGSANMWFTFVAQGPDVQVQVNGQVNTVYVTLGEFDPLPCDIASAGEITCDFGTGNAVIIDQAGLVIGNTYFFVVNLADAGGVDAEANAQICVTNDVPVTGPPNDDGCSPTVVTPNGSCVNGTTIGASDNFNDIPGCSVSLENGVFFEFTLSPGNLGVSIDLNNISIGGDMALMLGEWNPNCSSSSFFLLDFYCGPDGSDLIDYAGLVPGQPYFAYVASETIDEGDFQICVTEYGPPAGCSVNNDCNSAENLTGIVSGEGVVCVPGCNELASPFPADPAWACGIQEQEVVWYEFTSDADAGLLSMILTSDDIESPVLQVLLTDCGGSFTPLGECITGADGEVTITNLEILANTTYYILVSNDFGDGGDFELCVGTYENTSQCTTDSELIVQPGSPSLGSPDSGPFLPGETVTFCFTIIEYIADPIGGGNNCQWLQGIVPVFGDAWDLGSFNGSSSVPPNLYGGTWGWYETGITYKTNHPLITIGDLDGDGDIDICHYTELSCPNTGTSSGQVMPPGWFAAQNNGNPNSTYGDGNCCGCLMGPWEFCFEITTNDFETCDADEETDLSIKMYNFADGEVGLWGVENPLLISICGQDIPDLIDLSLNCCQGPMLADLTDVICPGGQVSIALETDPIDPNATFEWIAIDNPNTTGESDGAGTFITDVITNNTTVIQVVTYMIRAIGESGCPSEPQPIYVTVLPAIEVDAGPDIDGCAQGFFDLGGSPTAIGGDNNFTYDWGNAAIENIANPEAQPSLSTTYIVTVTDGNGCTSTDDIELDINPVFEVAISGDTLLCPDSPETFLTGAPDGGTPNYTWVWDGAGTGGSTNQTVFFNGNGLATGEYVLTLTVTDDNGCTGDQEVTVDIYDDPSIFIVTDPDGGKFCNGGSIQVFANAIPDPSDYTYNWVTPEGNVLNGSNIIADETGFYVLEVVSPDIFCTKYDSIFIEEIAPPEPEILAPDGVCNGDMVYISLDNEYDSYLWSTTETEDSILVEPGTYEVTVTNEAGCEGSTTITVNPFSEVVAEIGGSSAFCEGSSTILSVSDEFDTFEWLDENGDVVGTADTLLVTEDFLVDGSGTILILVTDENGCPAEASIDIEIQDFLVPNIIGDTSICPLSCTELDAGGGYSNYLWSNGDTVQVIQVCDAGTYFVTVFDEGGCTGEEIKIVTENILPDPEIIGEGGEESICPNSSIVLDAGEGYIGYMWEDESANQTLEVFEAGTYIVTVTDSEGCEATAEIEITVNIPPEPSYIGATTFCPGDSVLITPEDGYDLYEIDLDNNGSIDLVQENNDPFYVSVIGNSNIIVTDENGCQGSIGVSVDEFVSPIPFTTIDTASFCTDGSVFISVTEDFNQIEWFVNGESAGSGITIEVSNSGTYEVVVTDGNGCSASTTMEVIESTELFPVISGEDAICDNTPTELDAGEGYSDYDWGDFGDGQVITVEEAGIYVVTVSDVGGCSGTAVFVVSNSATPSVIVPEEASVCNNNNDENTSFIDFSNLIEGSNGIWEDTDLSGVNLSDPLNINFDLVTPGFYTFTFSTTIAIPPCEDQSYEMVVEVEECLCPSVSINGLDPLCTSSDIVDLDILKITTEAGSWTIVDGPGDPLSGSIFDPENAESGNYTIAFKLDDPSESCDSIAEIVIEVIAPPNSGTFDIPQTICIGSGDVINLESLLEGEDNGGIWTETSSNSSTGAAFDAASGMFDTELQLIGEYTFEYLVEGTTPCLSSFSEVIVIIGALPDADAGEDKLLNCNVLEVELGTDNSTGSNISFKWTELKGEVIQNEEEEIVAVTEDGTYVLEVVDEFLCVDTDTTIVTRNEDFPGVTLEGNDPFCFNENNGNLIATGFGGEGPYQFSIDGGLNFLDQNAFLELGAGTYTVIVQDIHECTGEEVITIDDPTPFEVDLGGNITLQNVEDTLLSLVFQGGNGEFEAAIWTVDGSIVCEGDTCLSYVIDLSSDRTVCVFATNSLGCVDSTCIVIRSLRVNNIYLGNTFTPNEDGDNDIFYIQGGEDVEIVNYFRIFNRWGEMVFTEENFEPNNPLFGWRGNFKTKRLNPGVYAYVTEVVFKNGDVELIQGDVTIVR